MECEYCGADQTECVDVYEDGEHWLCDDCGMTTIIPWNEIDGL